MTKLVILRHAKAEKLAPTDKERPLAVKGQEQARQVKHWLDEKDIVLDYAVVSTAARTRETFSGLRAPCQVNYSDKAYNAPGYTLGSLVAECPDEATEIVIVAHNPGITELANDCGWQGVLSPGSAVLVEWDGPASEFETAEINVVADFQPS